MIEVFLDTHPVGSKGEATRNGSFSVAIVAPAEFGLHTLVVRDAKSHRPIDGVMFIVRHRDQRGANDKREND